MAATMQQAILVAGLFGLVQASSFPPVNQREVSITAPKVRAGTRAHVTVLCFVLCLL